MGAAREIAAAMGWPFPYTLGVLGSWKMAPAYCQAVLGYDQRIGLDGAPAEAVDAKAKNLAARRLAELSARKAAKKAENIAWPAVVKSKCPHATRRDARAIARPGACLTPAAERVARLLWRVRVRKPEAAFSRYDDGMPASRCHCNLYLS
jgi:sRNA-binding protein